jgi:hypothetical protein
MGAAAPLLRSPARAVEPGLVRERDRGRRGG